MQSKFSSMNSIIKKELEIPKLCRDNAMSLKKTPRFRPQRSISIFTADRVNKEHIDVELKTYFYLITDLGIIFNFPEVKFLKKTTSRVGNNDKGKRSVIS